MTTQQSKDGSMADYIENLIKSIWLHGFGAENSDEFNECYYNHALQDIFESTCSDLAEKEAEIERYKESWRCFHCGECFTDRKAAQEHFGMTLKDVPGCQIDIAEYRRMEAVNESWLNESSEIQVREQAMLSEHRTEIRRAEEAGYDKGVQEGKKYFGEQIQQQAAEIERLNTELSYSVDINTHAREVGERVSKIVEYRAEIERLNRECELYFHFGHDDKDKQIEQLQAMVKEYEKQICIYGREESGIDFVNDAECLQWFKEYTSI